MQNDSLMYQRSSKDIHFLPKLSIFWDFSTESLSTYYCSFLASKWISLKIPSGGCWLRNIAQNTFLLPFDDFFFPKTTTDSERTRPRIKKVIIWLKSPINPLMIPQKFQSTNVAFVEISIHFDCHGIIEYQICWSIFPIVQANLRQKQPKLIVTKLF